MSLHLMLDVILGTTPVPGLSAAYHLLKIIVSSVQQAREGKRRLEALSYAVAQLLDTLNTEFLASRLVQSSSAKPLQELYSLLEDIQSYIREEQERPFLKALFSLDSPASDIEAFYRRIGAVASAFQISALLNIQRMLSNDERARNNDLESMQTRLRTMEQNQLQLWRTVGINAHAVSSTQGQIANGAVFQAAHYPAAVSAANPSLGWPQSTPDSTVVQAPAFVPHRERILIRPRENDQYQGFWNRSAYPMQYNGKGYASSEHLFQAFKYMDNRPDIAEKIRAISNPMEAFKYSMSQEAHQHSDWDRMCTAKMEIALYHKFAQHENLKQVLLRTGDAELIHFTVNSFWGVGKDQKGKNEQGKALERVRKSFQEEQRRCPPVLNSTVVPTTVAVAAPRERILVYPQDGKYHGFGNRSTHCVKYAGKEYPSSEHLFQAFKYMDNRPDIAETIRTLSKSPAKVFKYSMSQKVHQNPDWDRMCTAKMEIALYHKFTQHENLKELLLGTGNAELVRFTQDSFWGVGMDQKGRNEMGKALERVRKSLQETCKPT